MQMAEISTSPNTDSGDCGKPQVRSRQKHESGELFRWCQCFDPKERLAGLRMFVLLTTALTQVRAIISTEGALRLPTTYDNPIKDYQKDYRKDYRKYYQKDYQKDYRRDYRKDYGKDY